MTNRFPRGSADTDEEMEDYLRERRLERDDVIREDEWLGTGTSQEKTKYHPWIWALQSPKGYSV